VLNHHQRYCGGGYPARVNRRTGETMPALSGKQISVFSRIATICDVYDAATTSRVYQKAKLPVQVLYEMRNHCQSFFDPQLAHAFCQIIPPFPIGQSVTLSNGIEAVVVDFNAQQPCTPKVQGLYDPYGDRYSDSAAEEIDLALHTDLQIAYVDDVDVRPFVSSYEIAESREKLVLV
jgi:hypothetical protein